MQLFLELQNMIGCWAREGFRGNQHGGPCNHVVEASNNGRRQNAGGIGQVWAMLRGCMQLCEFHRHMQDSLFTCINQQHHLMLVAKVFSFSATS